MSRFFQFEADFVDSLRCIPMQVRYKLDTCGIKLKLPQWHQLSQAERQILVEHPCTTPEEIQDYRAYLCNLIQERSGVAATELAIEPAPAWHQGDQIPTEVQQKAQDHQHPLTLEQWAKLDALERFVLIKLSRSNHEGNNFIPALQEFDLI